MCNPCCLIIGCDTKSKEVPKPENWPDLKGDMLCPHCSKIYPRIYKKDKRRLAICFIPICPCGSSDTYMACSYCGLKVNASKDTICRRCQVDTPFECDYCPNCGTSKRGGENARQLNLH